MQTTKPRNTKKKGNQKRPATGHPTYVYSNNNSNEREKNSILKKANKKSLSYVVRHFGWQMEWKQRTSEDQRNAKRRSTKLRGRSTKGHGTYANLCFFVFYGTRTQQSTINWNESSDFITCFLCARYSCSGFCSCCINCEHSNAWKRTRSDIRLTSARQRIPFEFRAMRWVRCTHMILEVCPIVWSRFRGSYMKLISADTFALITNTHIEIYIYINIFFLHVHLWEPRLDSAPIPLCICLSNPTKVAQLCAVICLGSYFTQFRADIWAL